MERMRSAQLGQMTPTVDWAAVSKYLQDVNSKGKEDGNRANRGGTEKWDENGKRKIFSAVWLRLQSSHPGGMNWNELIDMFGINWTKRLKPEAVLLY